MIPVDPFFSFILIVGLIVYYAIKSIFTPSPPKDRPWSEVKRELDEERRQKKKLGVTRNGLRNIRIK